MRTIASLLFPERATFSDEETKEKTCYCPNSKVNKQKFSDFEFNVATWVKSDETEIKNDGNRMLRVNSLDDYSPFADSMETISPLVENINRGTCILSRFIHIC